MTLTFIIDKKNSWKGEIGVCHREKLLDRLVLPYFMVIEIGMLHQCPKQIGCIDIKDAKDAKDEDMCVHIILQIPWDFPICGNFSKSLNSYKHWFNYTNCFIRKYGFSRVFFFISIFVYL
jgi:hypothetical protein